MAKRNYPLHKVYSLLGPGPVLLLSTAGTEEKGPWSNSQFRC
jgi:hypothetical protein